MFGRRGVSDWTHGNAGKSEFGKRRFTLAHEAAHKLLERHNPMQVAAFRREFDSNENYDAKTLKQAEVFKVISTEDGDFVI